MPELLTAPVHQEDMLPLVDAVNDARSTLHAELQAAVNDGDIEATELIGETLDELQEALVPVYGEGNVPALKASTTRKGTDHAN